jgi:hypothetical protein
VRKSPLGYLLSIGLLLLNMTWSSFAEEGKEALGLVCFLSGDARLHGGSGKERPFQLYDSIQEGDQIKVGNNALLKIILFNGEAYEIRGPALAVIQQGKVKSLQGQVHFMPSVAIMPQIALFDSDNQPGRRMAASRIRGSANLVVAANHAKLYFPPAEGNRNYHVVITNFSGTEVFSLKTENATCTVPVGVLSPGREYYFNVWSEQGQTRTQLVRWKHLLTLGEEDSRSREILRQMYQENGEVAILLLLAELDRKLGLYHCAMQEFQEALAHYPDNPALQEAADRFTQEE